MSLHSDIARLGRLRSELNGYANRMGRSLGDALFAGGNPERVGVPELRSAATAAYEGLVVLESITDGLIAALSNIEIRLHQLNNAGTPAGLQH